KQIFSGQGNPLPPPSVGLSASPSASPSAAGSAAPAASRSVAAMAPLGNVPPQVSLLAKDANDHYTRAQDALKTGDFGTYGNEMKAVQQDLQQLQQLTGQS